MRRSRTAASAASRSTTSDAPPAPSTKNSRSLAVSRMLARWGGCLRRVRSAGDELQRHVQHLPPYRRDRPPSERLAIPRRIEWAAMARGCASRRRDDFGRRRRAARGSRVSVAESCPCARKLHWFESFQEAQEKNEHWRRDYDESRPQQAPDEQTPVECAARRKDLEIGTRLQTAANQRWPWSVRSSRFIRRRSSPH